MPAVQGKPNMIAGPSWPELRPQYQTLISPIFHFIIRNISVGGFLLKDLKNLLLIGFSWLSNYFPSKVRMVSDHQKNGNILLWSRPLTLPWPWLGSMQTKRPECHYIHTCVFCVLITCGPCLTGMFYPVSLYLIVCHLSSYWVTQVTHMSHDDRPSIKSQPHNLGNDLFNLVQNVIYGWTDDLFLVIIITQFVIRPSVHDAELQRVGARLGSQHWGRAQTLLTFPTTIWSQFGPESSQMLAIVL